MAQFTKEELDKILENHKHWINEDCENWENMMATLYEADLYGANLREADLRGADLREADLREANLREADLREADLREADLCEADLRGANLREANLREADLREADLREADLRGADLYGANLREADLREADLCGANLREANLRGANLRGANLRGANLRGADLYGADLREADLRAADLRGAKDVPFIPMTCPDSGSFIGWKKALRLKGYYDLDETFCVIVELEIPSDAKRSSATCRKCRCDKAIVKSIVSVDGSVSFDSAFSKRNPNFIYRVGEVVSVNNFDNNRFNECSTGIHFFINRKEAVDYNFC